MTNYKQQKRKMKMTIMNDPLLLRAEALKLHGVTAHWDEIRETDWIKNLIQWEEIERSQRGFERRLVNSQIGKRFKHLIDFDWSWCRKCVRQAVEELMQLSFMEDATNIIFCGPNGVGKSTIARNIAYQAILRGHTALFTTAADMLGNLASQDSDNALRRRMKYYCQPTILILDEVGFISCSNRYSDLLFQLISKRYENKSTLITTNKPFSEWTDMFPNVGSAVALIDRLVHHSEIINIEAGSFRFKEAKEKDLVRKNARSKKLTKVSKFTEEEK
jgi:DNA replication protein DnaC